MREGGGKVAEGSALERAARGPHELLERSAHLTALEESLAAIRDSREGRLLFVGGEAGVGKTALLRRFCAEQRKSARILWGSCDSLITPRPLGPLLDVAQATGGELEELMHSEAKPHEVVAALVRELKDKAPTIFVLDDVHWADDATLDLLRLLGRRIESVPVLVIAIYRDDEVDGTHPLRVVLGELATQHAVDRLNIMPLTQAAVAKLADSFEIDALDLYGKTAGNPFFVTEVLASGKGEIPDTVRDAVLGRAAGLSPAARTLLEAVAVVPPHAEVWLLEGLAAEAFGQLEECLSTGMLRTEPGGVAFRHELARLAIEDSLPPDRRVALHRKVLAALAVPPTGTPDVARLAHHAEAAGDTGAVLRHAPAAAERAALLGAHRESAAQYARALRFGDGLPPEERAKLLDRRALECYITDQHGAALQALDQALELHRMVGDRHGEGNTLRELARTLWCPGRTAEARAAATEAVAVLEPLPPGRELAMAYSYLSAIYKDAGDRDETALWGGRALALAERLGDDESLVRALINIAVMKPLTEGSEGRRELERGLDLAEQAGLTELVGLALVNGAAAAVTARSYATSDHYIEQGLRYCGERGLELYRLYLLAYRARSELDRGRWAEAIDSAVPVLGVPRNSTVPRINALVVLGSVRARRGEADPESSLEEARALADLSGELQRIAPAAAAQAEAAWLEGDSDAVAKATEGALDLAIARGAPWVIGELSYWRWRVGIHEEIPTRAAEPYALQIRGEWAAAAEQWSSTGCPYEAALARADSGEKDEIRSAFTVLHGLGASRTIVAVSRDLRARGIEHIPRGPRKTTRSDPAGLTGREGEVLDLIDEGLRNAEIAERLSLSERTVAHHVSSILTKLGVTSRGAAPAKARELRLR